MRSRRIVAKPGAGHGTACEEKMRHEFDWLPGIELLLDFLDVVGAIPLVRALQALFKLNGGFVTEDVSRAADFRLGVANVAIARRFVFCLQIFSGNAAKQVPGSGSGKCGSRSRH